MARRRAKLTQEGLALELKISQGMISHMETGYWEISDVAMEWIGKLGRIQKFEEASIKRRRLGLDIKQVAEEVGIPSWVLGKFEEGEDLPSRISELRAYCAWLGRQSLPSI